MKEQDRNGHTRAKYLLCDPSENWRSSRDHNLDSSLLFIYFFYHNHLLGFFYLSLNENVAAQNYNNGLLIEFIYIEKRLALLWIRESS
jgi:hypothetical protein